MRKFKIALVALLAVVLAVLCVTGSTFSWFSRPKTLTGKQLDLPASANSSVTDGLSFETYASSDGVTYDTTTVTNFSETAGLDSGARKYYRTDIFNSGTDAQSVSLYLQSLTLNSNGDAFALGVNGPTKNYKAVNNSFTGNMTHTGKMRVYFQPKDVWNDDLFDIYVDGSWNCNLTYHGEISGKKTYFADIPSSASKIYFKVANKNENYQRTAEYSVSSVGLSQKKSYVFYLNTGLDGSGYINSAYSSVTGSNFISYYSSITLGLNDTFPAALTKGTHYIGGSIEYYSGNESIFTVDISTGLITPISAGTAKLYSKIVDSSYDDDWQVETTVTVTTVDGDSIPDVPIVTNVAVLPSEVDSDGVIYPSVSVYWYIKNDSGSDGLKYTIPELYLTL